MKDAISHLRLPKNKFRERAAVGKVYRQYVRDTFPRKKQNIPVSCFI